jgi:DNA-binding SARP family transcriptional activator
MEERMVKSQPTSPLVQVLWAALEQGRIDPATAIREVEAGLPGGVSALVPFTRHPLPAVRLVATEALQRHRPAAAALRFTLLGRFSVTRGVWRAEDADWERRVAQRVVRLLILHRDRALGEDEIVETFWPDRPGDSARRSLHVAVSRARCVVDVPGAPSVIDVSDRLYRLRLRPGDSVDSDEFEAAARQALTEHRTPRMRLLERAASLWAGEPLPEERYSDWALGWRERLCDLHVAVLAALTDESLDRGDGATACLRARELIELEPLNEGAHRRLMVAHARAGRRNQALRQFLECRRALVERLGVEPATDTARLQRRILAGEPV